MACIFLDYREKKAVLKYSVNYDFSALLPISSYRYLYVPSESSEEDKAVMVRAFVAAGYDASHVYVARSVFDVIERLPSGVMLMVYSIEQCGAIGALLRLLARLQERWILLGSLREPWINEAIRDHAYCIEKFRNAMSLHPADMQVVSHKERRRRL